MDTIATFRGWRDAGLSGKVWSEDMWPRAFWFDAFLSHRRYDGSRALAATLADRGLRAYHDNDIGVRDARVEFELDAALRQSRYVVICDAPGLTDSQYCLAEYGPAIKHGASTGVERVLLAFHSSTSSSFDRATANIPTFDVDSDADIARLSHVLADSNKVGFPQVRPATLDVHLEEVFTTECSDRLRALNESSTQLRPQDEWALREIGWWAQAVLDGSLDQVAGRDLYLGEARAWLLRRDVIPASWHDYMWRCAFVMMTARAHDPNEVGAEMFLWIARHAAIPDEHTLILNRLWSETNGNGYGSLCELLVDRLEDLASADSDAIERAVVTFPELFSTSRRALLSLVSPTVRVKVDTPGFEHNELSLDERTKLLHRRLSELESTRPADSVSAPLSHLLSVLVEVRAAAAEPQPDTVGVLDVFRFVLDGKNDRPPIAARLDLPELIDFVYRPIARMWDLDPVRVRALLQSLSRTLTHRGFRLTAIALDQELATNGPFDTRDFEGAVIRDCEAAARDVIDGAD